MQLVKAVNGNFMPLAYLTWTPPCPLHETLCQLTLSISLSTINRIISDPHGNSEFSTSLSSRTAWTHSTQTTRPGHRLFRSSITRSREKPCAHTGTKMPPELSHFLSHGLRKVARHSTPAHEHASAQIQNYNRANKKMCATVPSRAPVEISLYWAPVHCDCFTLTGIVIGV